MHFKALLGFLSDLSENNHKAWFDENRPRYEAIRKEWLKCVQELITLLSSFDSNIADLETKNCIFRINRDVRFAKDKSPYKSNMGAYFAKGGKKSAFGGYYIHLDPKECFLAGGIWMPESFHLQAIRQEIDYHFADFKAVVDNPTFKNTFPSFENQRMVGVPKGYDKDNPAADYLKLKSFVVIKKLSIADLEHKAFLQNATDVFKTIKPLNDFLNKAIS